MANTNRPRGFSPISTSAGNPWNQQATLYSIPTDGTNTYSIGDVVMRAAGSDADGIPNIVKWTGVSAVGSLPLGVIVGFRVADPSVSLVGTSLALEKVYLNKSAGQHYAYVIDDPDCIYEIQGDSTVWATSSANLNCSVTIVVDQ